MNTLEFLRAVLPEVGGYYLALKRKYLDKNTGELRDGTLHRYHETLETLANAIEATVDRPQMGEVYHANQSFAAESVTINRRGKEAKAWRVRENLTEQAHKTLFIDIDCGTDKGEKGTGYATKALAFAALKDFLGKTGLPAPLVVDSGGGIHCYWPFTEAVSTELWLQLADKLKAACVQFEFITDAKCTTDIVRVLRPVGAVNRKYDPPRPITAKNPTGFKPHSYNELNARLSKLGLLVTPTQRPKVDTGGNLDGIIASQYPKSSLAKVAEHCAQIALVRDTRGDIGYEHWRGMIGIAAHCEDGQELAIAWSERRAETGRCANSVEDAQARLDDWKYGPTLCSFYQNLAAQPGTETPDHCKSCKYAGKIKTPIRLGGLMTEQPEVIVEKVVDAATEQEVEVEIPTIKGFVWKPEKGVMVQQFLDADGVMHESAFTRTRMFPIDRIRGEDGKYLLRMRMLLPNGKFRDFDLPTSAISAGGSELFKVLGAYEIYPTDNKDAAMRMTAFHRNWAEEVKTLKEEMQRYAVFGWTDDKSGFLLGSQLISKGKPDRQVMVSKGAAEFASALNHRTGTVEGWAKPVEALYGVSGMEPMQYALMSGFGSILTPFVGQPDYHGIPCYLYSSESGKGKSTVALLNIAAFCDPAVAMINGMKGATRGARISRMATFNNIPQLHDEMTQAEAGDAADLAFTMSNGRDRGRLRSDGQGGFYEALSGKWDCSAYMNGNTDLWSLLAAEKGNSLAEAVRIFQINLGQYNMPKSSPELFRTTVEQATQNRGVVGEAYIRWCVNNRERIDELIREETAAMSGPVVEDQTFRFYRYHMICTMVAARIMVEELGVLNFSLDVLRGWAHQNALKMCKTAVATNSITPEDALARMLGDLSPEIMVTEELRDARKEEPEEPTFLPRGALAGRMIHGNNKQQTYAGRLYLAVHAVSAWCQKNRVDPEKIMEAAESAGAVIALEHNRFYLGQGTSVPGARVRVICFDMHKLQGVATGPMLTVVRPITQLINREGGAA